MVLWRGTEDIPKIDSEAAEGLLGIQDSVAYQVHEIERHFHVEERWWGAVAVPDEINAIEANVDRPFAAISGVNAWGTAIPILGTADDPTALGGVSFDPHRIMVVDMSENADVWRIRFIWGTGTSAAAIAAKQWTEVMIISMVSKIKDIGGSPVEMRCPRIPVGYKMWCQVWNAAADTLSFFYGVHGYPG